MIMIFKINNDCNYTFNGNQRKNYIDNFAGISKADIHPTEKPLALMEDIVKLHTNKGDLILDPFAGSGTTLVAAQNLGRAYIGIELEEKHYKTCLSRLSEKKGSLLWIKRNWLTRYLWNTKQNWIREYRYAIWVVASMLRSSTPLNGPWN